MSFLELQNISKSFRSNGWKTDVLCDINLQISRGEFVAIVGYSGSGKTTLMSIISGLLRPDSGSIRLEGREVTGPGPDRGVVFQNYSLLPWMTVYENVFLAVDQVFDKLSAAEKRTHTNRYIDMVNLTPARDKKPGQLSGGMRQRVSLARTLAMEPDVLLLDEPLSALDCLTRSVLQDEIVRIWEQNRRTVVMITNDIDEAALMADRIIPLTPAPAATFGQEFRVLLDRPRDRTTLNFNPAFKLLRNQLTKYMLDINASSKKSRVARLVPLPDLQPNTAGVA